MIHCGRAACTNDLSGMRDKSKWCSRACYIAVRRGAKPYIKPTSGPSGIQVSYRRATMAMAVCLSTKYGVPVEQAMEDAEGYIGHVLSDKQRARLDERSRG